MGILRPADKERVAPVEEELPALMWSRDDGQLDLYKLFPPPLVGKGLGAVPVD